MKDKHEWTDEITGRSCVATPDGVVADAPAPLVAERGLITIGNRNRLAAREILRLAEENELHKALLVDELTRGAEEIRQLTAKSVEADRALCAQIGASLDLIEPAMICGGGTIPLFSMSLGGELLMAAFRLRQERDRLAEENAALLAALENRVATHSILETLIPDAVLEAVREGERARLRPLLARCLNNCGADDAWDEALVADLRSELGLDKEG